jgi:hypothetical protein
MAGKEVKPKTKPIDKDAYFYHHFEYSVSRFGLFDDADDGTPIVIGSRNLIDAVIRNLPKHITIFYYKKNQNGFWEKKIIYEGKKEIAKSQEK